MNEVEIERKLDIPSERNSKQVIDVNHKDPVVKEAETKPVGNLFFVAINQSCVRIFRL